MTDQAHPQRPHQPLPADPPGCGAPPLNGYQGVGLNRLLIISPALYFANE